MTDLTSAHTALRAINHNKARRYLDDENARAAYKKSIELTARFFGVSRSRIRKKRKHPRGGSPIITKARQSAVYLAVVACNCNMTSVARAANFSPEGVRKAVAAVEDCRDSAQFDAFLETLTAELVS